MTLKNKNTCGFLYYAHNNEVINYLKLAICSALTGRHQIPDFRAMVVTDNESLESLTIADRELLENLFEEIKINDDFKQTGNNMRVFLNGDHRHGTHPWYNETRPNAYTDSIYDETIMVDVDFLFLDNNLDKLWGSSVPVMMNKHVVQIMNMSARDSSGLGTYEMLGGFTVPQYWATIVYFNRSEFSEDFFNTITHIKDHYFYYQRLYQVDDNTYRNDHSFSIALYMTNGFRIPGKEWEIPYKFVLSVPRDDVFRVDKGQVKIVTRSRRNLKTKKELFNVQKMSLHCMNKVGLLYKYNELVKAYTND